MTISHDHDEGGWSKRVLVTLTPGIKVGDPGRFLSCPRVPHYNFFSWNKHLFGLRTCCLTSDLDLVSELLLPLIWT